MKDISFHHFANLFPLIEGDAFLELRESVRKNGLREAVVLHQGQILDGRNRYRACRQEGVKLRFEVFGYPLSPTPDWVVEAAIACRMLTEEEFAKLRGKPATAHLSIDFCLGGVIGRDALAYVIDKNLHRRHLDEGQRAMVAGRLAKGSHGGVRLRVDQDANLQLDPALVPAMTIAAAAKALNVSPRSVASARAVAEQGAPELVAAVDAGTVAVSAAETLAHLPKEEQTRLIKTASPSALYGVIKAQKDALTAQKKVKRAAREVALGAKQRALPAKKYGVIYADPAVSFASRSRDTGMDRSPDNHYPTMSTAELCALPVQDIAADDSVLFLWATVPMELDAHAMLKSWGFVYVSQYCWDKEGGAPGLGYWSRVDHELLLIGTRGNPPCPAPGTQRSSVIRAPKGRHSEKPAIVREMIEQYFPTLPKIELFARVAASEAWDVWGNEAPEEGEAEPVALPAKPAKGKKGRAYVDTQHAREIRIRSYLPDLSDDLDELKQIYRAQIDQLDKFMSAGDVEASRFPREMMEACILKANGGEHFGSACNARPMAVRAAGIAALGQIPRWGEAGHFIVEHRDIRAIVEIDHGAFGGTAIYALDFNRPFPSETGFHSLLGERREPGEAMEAFGRRLIDASIAYSETSRGKTRALVLPERVYRLQLGEGGRPVGRERGVWVDMEAPPLGLDLGLIEGLGVIRTRWQDEDRAQYSGEKRKGKRSCPVSLHANNKIIAVSGQMLTPVAEYPTSGAYVVTAFKWIDGVRVEGWSYVDEAGFHDVAPMPATADLAEDSIPAFLKRKSVDERSQLDDMRRAIREADMLGEGA